MALSEEACPALPPDDPALPGPARALLSGDPATPLRAYGRATLLELPLLALLCSTAVPPSLVVPAHDLARDLRVRALPVVGGFHSPLERDALACLLRGDGPLVACPARALPGMRLPRAWREALAAERLLILAAARPGRRRPTAAMAELRNRFVTALARRLFVVHATPGGAVYRVAREALGRGQPVLCFDHPANRDLVLLGARAVDRLP